MRVTRETSHFEMSLLNDVAPWNIDSIFVTLEISQSEISTLNFAVYCTMPSMLVTLDTSHPEISLLKDPAPRNMYSIFFTLDTSQFEMLPLNDDA